MLNAVAPEPGTDLVVAGAGGHGREIWSYVQDLTRRGWSGRLRGYVDDGLPPGQYGRLQVLGPIDSLAAEGAATHYLTAFGSNPLRRRIVELITAVSSNRIQPWTLIHPQASIGEDVEIGAGTCLAPGAIVTTKAKIGRHCILNVKASVSHDCVIGDYVNINPGATVCGSVTIGDGAYIGAGAVVKERISIGAWSIIGAGAAVVRDVPENVTVVGVPARAIRKS